MAFENSNIKIEKGCVIGTNCTITSRRNSVVKLGENVVMEDFNRISAAYSGEIEMENNITFGSKCFFSSQHKAGIFCGEGGLYSTSVNLIAGSHNIYNGNNENITNRENIVIGNHVWIGVSVTVLAGASVGQNSIIGAGSVVTKKFSENCILAGNPAKILRNDINWTI